MFVIVLYLIPIPAKYFQVIAKCRISERGDLLIKEQRLCHFCHLDVEDECQLILKCSLCTQRDKEFSNLGKVYYAFSQFYNNNKKQQYVFFQRTRLFEHYYVHYFCILYPVYIILLYYIFFIICICPCIMWM